MIHHRLISASVVFLSVLSLPVLADGARPAVFTSAQAKAGKVAYESSCGLCHLSSLQGRSGGADELPNPDTLPANYQKTIDDNHGYVPPLVGADFMAKWAPKTAGEFVARIKNAAGGFPPKGGKDAFLSVAAYILKANGSRSGKQELTETSTVPVEATLAKAKPQKP